MSTTFFGEVNELSSRAVYWSDEESDEEADEPQPSVEINVCLNLDHNLTADCKTVFVSLTKSDKTAEKVLTRIGSITADGSAAGVGHLFAVDKTSVWLRLNASHPNLKNHLLVKTISSVLKQLLSKLVTKPTIVLISKDLMKDSASDDTITYLTSDENNRSVIPSAVKSRPLLAPKMLSDLVEASVFEYCTVFGVQSIALLLPECQSKQMVSQSIPKPIIDSINQLNQLFDSNIYI